MNVKNSFSIEDEIAKHETTRKPYRLLEAAGAAKRLDLALDAFVRMDTEDSYEQLAKIPLKDKKLTTAVFAAIEKKGGAIAVRCLYSIGFLSPDLADQTLDTLAHIEHPSALGAIATVGTRWNPKKAIDLLGAKNDPAAIVAMGDMGCSNPYIAPKIIEGLLQAKKDFALQNTDEHIYRVAERAAESNVICEMMIATDAKPFADHLADLKSALKKAAEFVPAAHPDRILAQTVGEAYTKLLPSGLVGPHTLTKFAP